MDQLVNFGPDTQAAFNTLTEYDAYIWRHVAPLFKSDDTDPGLGKGIQLLQGVLVCLGEQNAAHWTIDRLRHLVRKAGVDPDTRLNNLIFCGVNGQGVGVAAIYVCGKSPCELAHG